VQLGPVLVVEVALARPRATAQPARVIRQIRMLEVGVEHVEPEAGDRAVEPEAHHVEARGADRRVVPVEVRLLGKERVQVVLAGLLVEGPCRTTEIRAPVVGGPPPARRIPPHVPVAARVVTTRPRSLEPRVQVRRVVQDQVEDHADTAAAGRLDEQLEVLHRPERRVDGAVVGDVVADVAAGRDVDRREPEALDAQRPVRAVVEVVEPLDDPPQIADAVAVGVAEAAWIDVVDRPRPPPWGRRGCLRSRTAR
jgi:hypothetical protein